MKLVSYCNKIIEYSFYALFFIVPFIFTNNTSELFEFNKMWVTFGITAILGAAWIIKMAAFRRLIINPTVFAIPLLLFLVSQIISSIFSLDQHVSWWGYYSRFNGGLLSTITYIFLYFAFVSNFLNKHQANGILGKVESAANKALHRDQNTPAGLVALDGAVMAKRLLVGSLFTGLVVALWGLPSHFGYDPTCLLFRGQFDTSCWTDAFKPTVRAFSTLGQPAWFAAYLGVLLPIVMAFTLFISGKTYLQDKNKTKNQSLFASLHIFEPKVLFLLALGVLFYLDLIFASTRAGTIAFFIGEFIFWIVVFAKALFPRRFLISYFLIFHIIFFVASFFFGMPIQQLNKFTYTELSRHASAPVKQTKPTPVGGTSAIADIGGDNITDSGKIRLYVWTGAIETWKANPIFGTGVETFAYAYYKYKPVGHNTTSEWDYLYNKAHNEYLNYLATTGAFGLGTYLLIIVILGGVILLKFTNMVPVSAKKYLSVFDEHAVYPPQHTLLIAGIAGGYIAMLISNFFGFSVVIINVYIFLFPALALALFSLLQPKRLFVSPSNTISADKPLGLWQWVIIIIAIIFSGYSILNLFQYWYADINYALGQNLDSVGTFNAYEQAYQPLLNAVSIKPSEPVYKDQLSINLATLATGFFLQKDATHGAQFAQNAIQLSNDVVIQHPNNVVFWKDRVRVLYTLGQADQEHASLYVNNALQAITKASELAPTDAKIWYNYGVLTGETGDIKAAIKILKKTTTMKPDYRDAYYALGLFYHQLAINDKGKVVDTEMQQNAIDTYQYILDHIDPTDKQVQKSLTDWRKQ